MKTPLSALAAAACLALAPTAGTGAGDAGPARHLIYLHGRIVQETQSARPEHPKFGFYELEQIREAFRGRGFVVTSELRPQALAVSDAADRVVAEVRELLRSGVPADHVTVVGASMGASITYLAAVRLENPDLRFVTLGSCLHENVRHLVDEEGRGPSGHLLSIRETSDDLTGPCTPWTGDLDSRSKLEAREIVLSTGLSHGFIYRPLPEWVEPAVAWAKGTG